MSSAHRPTWTPAQGKSDNRHITRVTGVRELPSQTTLKYRQAQGDQLVPPSNDFGKETRAELKARLARAEREARNKKRTAQGLEPEPESSASEEEVEEEQHDQQSQFKRPRTIEQVQAVDLKGKARAADPSADTQLEDEDSDAVDLDDGEEDEEDEEIEARARAILKEQGGDVDDSDDEEAASSSDEDGDDDDDDDDEDETAQLMKELEKIKAERATAAAQKAREEEEAKEKREEEIARGNPLLNDGFEDKETIADDAASSVASFGVKRRWDDDVIFKNQSAGSKANNNDFVNDLTRTSFHKEFLHRYIK